MDSSTATTVVVLAGGAALAAGAYAISNKWKTQQSVSVQDVLIAALPAFLGFGYLWWLAGDKKPSTVQTIASGIRGASRSSI